MMAKSLPEPCQHEIEGAFALALGFSNRQKIASGLRKMSAGPTKPRIARCMLSTATSALMAAEAPFESESCFARADRAEWNIVRHDEPDGRLDLFRRGAQHGAIGSRRGDRAVDDVVDLVVLQRKHLGQPPANLVQAGSSPCTVCRPSSPATCAAATATG